MTVTKAPRLDRRILSTLFLLLMIFALLVHASVAWFAAIFPVAPDGQFSASSIAAYFAGGDGNIDTPYEIEKPIHLYNLAWLQYLGLFNQDKDGDGQIEQNYFVLNNDVDMTGLVIPPIGTEENPFIGHFDGGNNCIRNATVANYVSKADGDGGVKERPAAVETIDNSITVDGNREEHKSIIGFFGVIGDWNDALQGSIVDDTATVEIAEKVNAVHDFRLDGLTIRSKTEESLMGLLAGYVNGSIKNVGVGAGALVAGENVMPLQLTGLDMQPVLSRYSLIGEYNEADVAWPNKPIMGGWGDSIAMKDMYTRLSEEVYPQAKDISYIDQELFTYDTSGNLVNHETHTATTNHIRVVDMGSAGNYSFSTYTGNVNSTTFMYLYGPSAHTKDIIDRRPTNRVGDYIFSDNNYLSVGNNGGVTSATAANAYAWTLSDEGYLYTVYNNTYYYLNRNTAGNLALSPTASTQWLRDDVENTVSCMVGNDRYFLQCHNGTWQLQLYEPEMSYYTISDGNVYLNNNGGTIAAGTDASTATKWYFSETSPMGGTIWSEDEDGTRYYLYTDRSSLTLRTQSGTDWTGNTDNELYYSYYGFWQYYIIYSNSNWTVSRNSSTAFVFDRFQETVATTSFELGIDRHHLMAAEYYDTTRTETYTIDTTATYFPLAVGTDGNGNEIAAAGNTGYVVSGSDYQHQQDAPQRSGNIRVSQYSRSDISNSVSNNSLNNARIYTRSYKQNNFGYIGTLANVEANWGLRKYQDSFEKFNMTVSEDSNVYGLHFMDATIDINKKITIDNARILKSDGTSPWMDGYELPRNAITFNVPEDGYVNFFAGTYFSGNSSFFSFYEVQRDETGKQLTAIKEISKIYGPVDADNNIIEGKGYVYRYTDNSYSATLPADYVEIFDTAWITDPEMHNNYVYYFEIPVNAGEFALGSVSGSDGAYLLYLDLAANGSQNIADDPEHTIMGVNFVDDAGLELEDISTYPGTYGTLSVGDGITGHTGVTAAFDRTSTTAMTYEISGDADSVDIVFAGTDQVTVAPGTVNVSATPPATASLRPNYRRRNRFLANFLRFLQ